MVVSVEELAGAPLRRVPPLERNSLSTFSSWPFRSQVPPESVTGTGMAVKEWIWKLASSSTSAPDWTVRPTLFPFWIVCPESLWRFTCPSLTINPRLCAPEPKPVISHVPAPVLITVVLLFTMSPSLVRVLLTTLSVMAPRPLGMFTAGEPRSRLAVPRKLKLPDQEYESGDKVRSAPLLLSIAPPKIENTPRPAA